MKVKKGNKRYKDKTTIQDRLSFFSILICLVFLLLTLRLGYLAIIKGKALEIEAEEQWRAQISIPAKRGDILDRNGDTIVSSANVYRVDLDLKSFWQTVEDENLDFNKVVNDISSILGMSTTEVLDIVKSKKENSQASNFPNLARGIEKEKADKIEKLKIYGIIINDDVKRYYPNGNFLSHTIGSINLDGQGLTGVELQYDDYLTGVPGLKIQGQDAKTNKLPLVPYKFTPPIDGKNVELTVDNNLQRIAEKIAEKGLTENKAKRVSVTIMDPNNGEVLAIVNKPDYNPNNPFDGYESFKGETADEKLQSMWRNNLINDIYEPGSTFKTITMVAAMEEGTVSQEDTFNCTGGVQFGSHTIRCWNLSGHGVQTLPEILKNSCNVGFMELGKRLGREKLNEYIQKLGFGELTGIDLPGEAEGIVKPNEEISEMDLAAISFGQTNSVTGIQLMTAFNAIANGGDLIQPHLMKKVYHEDENGKKIIDEILTPKIKKDVLSDKNTSVLRGYLERTATQDGPPGSFVQGYNVGGKTGTAEKVDIVTGQYSKEKYVASMVALAPVDNPKITAFIVVDEPSAGKYYGGLVATPLMKDLMTDVFKYLETPLAIDRYSVKKDIVIPNVRGLPIAEARNLLEKNSLTYKVQGSGESIISMEPYPGSTVEEDTEIKLYTSGSSIERNIIMPDLKGRSVEFAGKLLEQLGIKYTIEGQGDIYHQSIPGGSLIEVGDSVKLTLKVGSEY